MPLTGVILLGIFLVVLSYREVVTVYTRPAAYLRGGPGELQPAGRQEVAAVALMVELRGHELWCGAGQGSAAILSTFPALARPLGDTATLLLITVAAATLSDVLRGTCSASGRTAGSSRCRPTCSPGRSA